MKVGDMVKFCDGVWERPMRIGVLVGYGNFAEDWWEILDSTGVLVVWPESQLEAINESR